MNPVLIFAALIAAAPAVTQHAGHTMSAPTPAASPHSAPVDAECTPEHAAMGHCKLDPPPAQTRPPSPPASAVDPECPPEHAAMGHCTPSTKLPARPAGAPPKAPVPATGLSGPEHAADAIWGAGEMARARRAVYAEHGGFTGNRVLLDRLEYRAKDGADGYAWEGDAWFGGDYDRLWLKTEGEGAFGDPIERAEVQALFSRAIDPWFNLQAGLRQDFGAGPGRTHLTVGMQGLAPYWFELDAALFLSAKGDLTGRIEAEYDQRLTNRLILQPRVELDFAAQDVRELGIGAGLSSLEAGLRLRYEFVPEFAPYLGIAHERAIGRTADLARAAGESAGGWAFVAGIRAWF